MMNKILDLELLFISDPGHGWLQVPIKMLEDMGIADKISGCSYMKGTNAYLEEDCDASLFISTLGYRPIFAEKYEENTKIRDYQDYNYELYKQMKTAKLERLKAYRREKHEALTSLGLNRVVGGLGGVYYE